MVQDTVNLALGTVKKRNHNLPLVPITNCMRIRTRHIVVAHAGVIDDRIRDNEAYSHRVVYLSLQLFTMRVSNTCIINTGKTITYEYKLDRTVMANN